MARLGGIAVIVLASLAPGVALAQAATASATMARAAAVGELSSAIGALAAQTAASGQQAAVSMTKGLETASGAINGQALTLAAGGAAREAGGTGPRACPEVSAMRARGRAAADAALAGAGSGTDDAAAVWAGNDRQPVPRSGDGAAGGDAALAAAGMPLPRVPAPDGSVATEARRVDALRRAAFVMTARSAIAQGVIEP